MKKIPVILPIMVFTFASCGTKIETEEVNGLVFGYDRGLMVGVDIGDNWEDVKKNCREGWDIREEDNIYQFRKDWDQGNDMMYVTFSLDENKNIDEMEFKMNASTGNLVELKNLEKMFIQDFNLITIEYLKTDWTYYAPNGETYTIILNTIELDEYGQMLSIYAIKQLKLTSLTKIH